MGRKKALNNQLINHKDRIFYMHLETNRDTNAINKKKISANIIIHSKDKSFKVLIIKPLSRCSINSLLIKEEKQKLHLGVEGVKSNGKRGGR